MMVLVAIVGLVLGSLIERRCRFRRLASHHQAECERLLRMPIIMFAGSEDDPVMRRLEWHLPRRFKYERAALYPWLSIESEPPEPEYVGRPFTPGTPERCH
jgi:hypothetical protein